KKVVRDHKNELEMAPSISQYAPEFRNDAYKAFMAVYDHKETVRSIAPMSISAMASPQGGAMAGLVRMGWTAGIEVGTGLRSLTHRTGGGVEVYRLVNDEGVLAIQRLVSLEADANGVQELKTEYVHPDTFLAFAAELDRLAEEERVDFDAVNKEAAHA